MLAKCTVEQCQFPCQSMTSSFCKVHHERWQRIFKDPQSRMCLVCGERLGLNEQHNCSQIGAHKDTAESAHVCRDEAQQNVSSHKASTICTRAAELVSGDREQQHGDKVQNHQNIADLWSTYLHAKGYYTRAKLTSADAAVMMLLVKVARTCTGSFNLDDYIDAAGYAGCAGEIAARLKAEFDNDEAAFERGG